MKLSDFDYHLPKELIAQYPLSLRDTCRLLVLERKTSKISHYQFKDIIKFLQPLDILVLNDTMVLPCRLLGQRITGGRVEVLLLKQNNAGEFIALFKPSRLKMGERLIFNHGNIEGKILSRNTVVFNTQNLEDIYRLGVMPLPAYIKRKAQAQDFCDYQTVYAKNPGAIASPTAGLHFTKELLEEIAGSGVELVHITLHTGYGTFKKIRTEEIEKHKMDEEYFTFSSNALGRIQEVEAKGGRLFAVGTTVCRAVETYATFGRQEGYTDLIIYPGYKFKMIDVLLTNFHLSGTTTFMLVCAFAGEKLIRKAYQEAIDKKYRFLSFGDAMLII